VRFSRTLAVTTGHSKSCPEQARCPMTRCDEIAQRAVRFPQLHEKCHPTGKMQRVDGMIVPPSNRLAEQGKRGRIVALTRR
jgi:hypothetical protein